MRLPSYGNSPALAVRFVCASPYSIDKIIEAMRNGRDEDRLRQIVEKLGFTQEWFFQRRNAPGEVQADKAMIPLYATFLPAIQLGSKGAQSEAWVEPPPGPLIRRLFALRVRASCSEILVERFAYLDQLSIRLASKTLSIQHSFYI